MSAPIYTTNWKKYEKAGIEKLYWLEGELKRTFHTCPSLMERKKQLEKLVRQCKSNRDLTRHFRTDFKKRKEDFYRRIIYDIVSEDSDLEKQICDITKDILYIYSEKQTERESLEHMLNDADMALDQAEQEREWLIESFRDSDC